ncbi:hypothetical protein [Shewanella waksmanii]|uniref:hypothetical protein n=1 Tax=Shewanella waksmanii TaxID=213783 RepID=UPI00048D3141|nr:hypothetical protein [Shewanella waksmanii]
MPKVQWLLMVITWYLLSACSSLPPSDTRQPHMAETKQSAPAATRVAGRYYWGHEVSAFSPCNNQQSWWVRATPVSDTLKQQSLLLAEQRGAPYQPLYVEVSIHQIDRQSHPAYQDGFAADYDAVIEIIAVHQSDAQVPASCGDAS